MLVVDTNVLVYAANKDSSFHHPCRRWLREVCKDPSPTFLTWSVCYEFLRVATHPRVFESPWTQSEAHRYLAELLASPGFDLLIATPRHTTGLAQTIAETPALRGNLMHDLHTAVLMREHGISKICTRDSDFRHFPFLTIIDPLQQPRGSR
ncbi:MAG: PIN domain-containing protein [Bryobacterales bacterium]|nr:PIN domain-containing protein [Bryobacterales bacterium]